MSKKPIFKPIARYSIPVKEMEGKNDSLEKLYNQDNITVDTKQKHEQLKYNIRQYKELTNSKIDEYKCNNIIAKYNVTIPELEYMLSGLNKIKTQIETKYMVNILNEMGIDKCDVEAENVTVSKETIVSMKVYDEERFFEWLREKGYGDAIKEKKDVLHWKRRDAIFRERMYNDNIPEENKYPDLDVAQCNIFTIAKIKEKN